MAINIPRAVVKAGNAKALVAQLKALSDDEHAEWTATMKKSLPVWRQVMQWGMIDRDDITKTSDPTRRKILNHAVDAFDRHHHTTGRLLLVAVALGATPAQSVKLCHTDGLTMLEREEATGHLADLMIERGTEWVEETMTGLLARPATAAAASSLITRLVIQLDLPVPHVAAHLGVWFGTLPAPGTRWQDHFLAACATPDVFWQSPERDKHIARIREAATALRLTEPTDDDALLDGLLQVLERGERPGPQREALAWIEGLDLDLSTRPARLLRALDLADARVAAAFSAALLAMPLDDDTLTQLALAVLPRKEKGLKRDVLKHLTQLTTPTAELTELVTELSRDTDTTTAKLASTLCDQWGTTAAPHTELLGLWQEPSLPDPEPFPALPVPNEPELLALLHEAEHSWRATQQEEQLLAVLVATAHERGPESIVAACRSLNPEGAWGTLARLLVMLGEGSIVVGTEPEPPSQDDDAPPLLAFLDAQRARGVLHRLGELPVLLSVPSTSRWEVTAADLRSRIEQYQQEGVALEPADLAVALGRCDRNRTDELTGLDAPIRGLEEGFAAILTLWRETTVEPPTFVVADPPGWLRPISVRGDEPWWHETLGVASWGHCIPAHLLPGHLGREIGEVFNDIARSGPAAALERLLDCLAVARILDEPLIVATLATAGVIPTKDRASVAAELLQAWDEGRLTPDDLATAWHSPLWEQFQLVDANLHIKRSDAKITSLLVLIAEAGGLALVWPLLTEIAEDLAAADKVPATAGTVFETVLALLPEVPHPVELPNITALAARKGSSKAITLARTIAEKVVSH